MDIKDMTLAERLLHQQIFDLNYFARVGSIRSKRKVFFLTGILDEVMTIADKQITDPFKKYYLRLWIDEVIKGPEAALMGAFQDAKEFHKGETTMAITKLVDQANADVDYMVGAVADYDEEASRQLADYFSGVRQKYAIHPSEPVGSGV